MDIDLGTLVNHADHLDTCRRNHVKHHVPSLRKTAIASLQVTAFPNQPGISRQFFETTEMTPEVALRLYAAIGPNGTVGDGCQKPFQ